MSFPSSVFSATFRLVLSDSSPSVRKYWSGNTGAALTKQVSGIGAGPEDLLPLSYPRRPTPPAEPVHVGGLRCVNSRRGSNYGEPVTRVVPAINRRNAPVIHGSLIGPLPHPPRDRHAAVWVASRGMYLKAHLRLPLGQDHQSNVFCIHHVDGHVQVGGQLAGVLT